MSSGPRFALLAIAVLAGACSALPSNSNRSISTALSDTADTRLGRAIAPRVAQNPGTSGVHALLDARDAFAARVLLARAAERSLDVQYYIWHNDLSGTLLFEALREAADRGVRVRLLLDDNNTSDLDAILAGLAAHPNIEVRLFNPFAVRKPRVLGYLTDFLRLNRRMHNKSFTADNQATIIGGRNIGDEYFDAAAEGIVFIDLDVIAVGPAVQEVSADFDRYWSSESAYPAERMLTSVDQDEIQKVAASASRVARDPAAAAYLKALRDSPFVRELLDGRLAMEWAPTRMVSDDPAKGLGAIPAADRVLGQIRDAIGEPRDAVDLVSAYFVPGEAGTQMFAGLAQRSVKVRILTNSLEATDVAPVHAGYAKRRRKLLEAGVTLYELRRLSPYAGRLALSVAGGSAGSSASSLHAKTFGIDGSRAFIGSFNFDPRSARLNTELGFIIDSPTLARDIAEAFETGIPAQSYEVRLAADGSLYWIERKGNALLRHDIEPGTTLVQRLGVWFLSLLPIDWLL
jgi:cardiolipin synthase C